MTASLKSYVPRHMRLGLCCEMPEIEAFHEVREEIPLLDDNGKCLSITSVIKCVPVAEAMLKYKLEQFKLSAMIDAGVPLKLVNINASDVSRIEDLYRVCSDMDNVEKYVKVLERQRLERESWLQPNSVNDDDELNEVY